VLGHRDDVEVRRIRSDDWTRLRDIRIDALTDTPLAFITTLDEARNFPDSLWKERADEGAVGDGQITVIAVDGERTVGMAVGLRRSSPPVDVVPIVSVFVSRSARRGCVGRRLMDGVERWARREGPVTTSLWVVDGNDAAIAFYESLGYVATFDRHLITVPPQRWETRYAKRITRAG
jgi:GNAT superfamily N-acetyltransferase